MPSNCHPTGIQLYLKMVIIVNHRPLFQWSWGVCFINRTIFKSSIYLHKKSFIWQYLSHQNKFFKCAIQVSSRLKSSYPIPWTCALCLYPVLAITPVPVDSSRQKNPYSPSTPLSLGITMDPWVNKGTSQPTHGSMVSFTHDFFKLRITYHRQLFLCIPYIPTYSWIHGI